MENLKILTKVWDENGLQNSDSEITFGFLIHSSRETDDLKETLDSSEIIFLPYCAKL